MTRTPYSSYRVSECLSVVMDDIGVNETMVMKRRRTFSLMEHFDIARTGCTVRYTTLYFGSQIEGSTTAGLYSDIDKTLTPHDVEVIQHIEEWNPRCHNLMMIRNKNVPHGYCYLQKMSKHSLQEQLYSYSEIFDTSGKNLLLRKFEHKVSREMVDKPPELHGPAITFPPGVGFAGADIVHGYRGDSLPCEVKLWLQRHTLKNSQWPTLDVLKDCERSGCFAVPKGSPESDRPELEWIISTALQERYLMFSLNITQLRCFILMKIILKTFIDPHVEDVLTSFMCKNVLWYCIANSSRVWHTGNLFSYLQLCLFMLKEQIALRNCPHFIIPGNNLLTGRMTVSQQRKLLEIINNLITKGEELLFHIDIDTIGDYLMKKLNDIPYEPLSKLRRTYELSDYATTLSQLLVDNIAKQLGASIIDIYDGMVSYRLEMAQLSMFKILLNLEQLLTLDDVSTFPHSKLDIVHTASALHIPLVRSVLGSMLACTDIVSKSVISDQALSHLIAGKVSDGLSGRLKLVSVLYCTGDINQAHQELFDILTHCNVFEVYLACSCILTQPLCPALGHGSLYGPKLEDSVKTNVALCTRFLHCELPCVPFELRYEILRSYIPDDRPFREKSDYRWMDTIVVNSISYFYYLQYIMYRHLHKRVEQQAMLFCFAFNITSQFCHKETSLNLLGLCYEQENRQQEALQCYIDSLKHRPRNNAAKYLLCIQLYKLKLLRYHS